MTPKTEVAPSTVAEAGTRIVAGVAMISDGMKEIPYPETATELVRLAMENGWGFDDGLPAKVSEDGTPYVRLLIGRERGKNALTEDESPGIQFHISWWMNSGARKAWTLGQIYMKTSEHEGWQTIKTVLKVRATISGHPVKMPDVYVSADN